MHAPLRSWVLPFIFLNAILSAHAQCCEHTLVMYDEYGDGWNGGSLQVALNGVVIGTFSAQGSGSLGTFEVCTGDVMQLVYSPGEWEEENRYRLYGPMGVLVFSDGPGPAAGVVYEGSGDCSVTVVPGDSPCAALPIDTVNCVLADNTEATGSAIDPGCANYQGGDVWFTMAVPPSGNISVTTSGTGGLNDTGVAIWSGPNCYQLQLEACDDDAAEGYYSRANAYELSPGAMLFIQAFGYGGGTGTFDLCVTDLGVVELESSELPIVMINTLGQEIPFDGKIDALMEVKYNGPANLTFVSDPANEYNGHIGIGIRGATSADYPQSPFGIETRTELGENNNVPILGMPQENDWVLLSNYNDRSLVRNALAGHLSRGMGQYAPRTHLCEVLVDSVYRGIYLFGEKIKRDSGRVDIATLNDDENNGDDLTGGYILQQNHRGENDHFFSNYSPIGHPDLEVHFLYEYPEPSIITGSQRDYIASFVDSLETALYGADFTDTVVGYRKYLDVPSFITYFLVNEVARNNDGFKKSVFFHKDKNSNGGRLKAGPVWDFDWAWKDLAICSIMTGTDGSGWSYRVNECGPDNNSTGWYVRLLQDEGFANELRCRYEEYRASVLSTERMFAFIDSVGARVQNAQARHFQKWPILGISGPAPEVNPIAATYMAELDTLKNWITRRLAWLDDNIPGLCAGVQVPEVPASSSLTAFPNPGAGLFRFQGLLEGPGPWSVTVHDVSGREVERVPLRPGPQQFELMIKERGAYSFVLQKGRDTVQQGRLIVL